MVLKYQVYSMYHMADAMILHVLPTGSEFVQVLENESSSNSKAKAKYATQYTCHEIARAFTGDSQSR